MSQGIELESSTKLYAPQEGVDPRALARSGEEVWAPLGESDYFVSNLGNVYDAVREKVVLPHASTKHGYLMLHLRGKGKQYVHRLVVQAFEGGDEVHLVTHENMPLSDNRLCNLVRKTETRGRLSAEDKKEIRARLEQGVKPVVVAREFGISSSHVNYYRTKS